MCGRVRIVVLALFVLAACSQGTPRLSDQSFVNQANDVCAEAHRLDEADPPASEGASYDERADRVDRITARLDDMVQRLRAIPVEEDDRDAVDGWLGHWDEFLDVGTRYAAAIRTGKPETYERVGNEGDRPATLVNNFARANGLDQCVF